MTYAIEKMNADVMFEMDADLSHDPNKIPDFLKKLMKDTILLLEQDIVREDQFLQIGAYQEKCFLFWKSISKNYTS